MSHASKVGFSSCRILISEFFLLLWIGPTGIIVSRDFYYLHGASFLGADGGEEGNKMEGMVGKSNSAHT